MSGYIYIYRKRERMCLWQARMSWNKRVWYRQRQRRSKRQRWEQRCLYNFHFSFASLISISLRSVIYNVFVLFSFLIFFVFLGVLIQRDILFRFLCLCEFDLCASFHVGLSVYGVCVCVCLALPLFRRFDICYVVRFRTIFQTRFK